MLILIVEVFAGVLGLFSARLSVVALPCGIGVGVFTSTFFSELS